MIKLKTKNEEYDHFNRLSNEWWDDTGKFKILHKIRPIRIEYILNQTKNKNIKNLDILDIGCGGGLVSESLAKLGGNITAVDFVNDNIKIAKQHSVKNKLKINYMCKDVEKMNLNKKFDIIVMFEILEHLEDWKVFLKKIDKNIKKNGKIIISTINRNIISKYTAIYLAENILQWIPKGTHEFEKFIKPQEINKYSRKNNYRFEKLTGLIYNPIYNEWDLSKNTKINYFCTLIKN